MSPPRRPTARSSPLAALLAHTEQAAQAAREAAGLPLADAGRWPDLRSAQRFCQSWERLGAEHRVQQARLRAPQNAGPLNPQRLMLQTLVRMGEISPHYLGRIMAYAETLLWLEETPAQSGRPARSTGPAASRSGRPGPARRRR